MRIYISGKITGKADYMVDFCRAENRLKQIGHEVINPAMAMQNFPASTTQEEFMTVALAMLEICDAIYLLKDWEDSFGAKIEQDAAAKDGKAIFCEGSFEPDPSPEYLRQIEQRRAKAKERREKMRRVYGEMFDTTEEV